MEIKPAWKENGRILNSRKQILLEKEERYDNFEEDSESVIADEHSGRYEEDIVVEDNVPREVLDQKRRVIIAALRIIMEANQLEQAGKYIQAVEQWTKIFPDLVVGSDIP